MKKMSDLPKNVTPQIRLLLRLPVNWSFKLLKMRGSWQMVQKSKLLVAYGEFDFASNSGEIMRGTDILVATPGRLLHFLSEGIVSLVRLKCLCLDEADRLLDESFKEDFNKLIRADGFPEKKNLQMLLFGATYPKMSERWIDSVLKRKHATVKNARANAPNARIVQTFEECSSSQKLRKVLDYVVNIIQKHRSIKGNEEKTPRILIFVQKCQTADSYTFYLIANGIEACSLNSQRGQRSREETMCRFRENKASVIVATDVMSRGVDIKDLQYVINLDIPEDFFTYVQRIGRTGRLETGYAHSFIDLNKNLGIVSELVHNLRKDGSVEVPQFMLDVVKPRRNIVNTTLPVE
ncbi:hypothetical protein M3Y97_00116500 [Aphelenchoides bicaudatus]|nr:hypothetical protein M3Y97_00116500 [Aphelenchoides bicaudatus]